MIKEFKIVVEIEEEDFCFSDLKEAIIEGVDNVGNFTYCDVYEAEK